MIKWTVAGSRSADGRARKLSTELIDDLRRELAEARAERDEALARETATAEVLHVINSSLGNLAPVFHAVLEKAIGLCEGAQGTLWMFDGDGQYAVAAAGVSPEVVNELREPREIHPYQQRLRHGGKRLPDR